MAINSMELGWLDLNQDERNKVREILELIQDKSAMDELGIGTIRDAFSNIFFPGITTIQTRAKYLVVLPYLFKEVQDEMIKVAKNNGSFTPNQIKKIFDQKQDELVPIFMKNCPEEKGIIGKRKRHVIRNPMFVYWGALQTYEIVTNKVSSITGLCQSICQNSFDIGRKSNDYLSEKKKKSAQLEDSIEDSKDATLEEEKLFYCPSNSKSWKTKLNMNLKPEEATFLYNKITQSHYSRDTLLGKMLEYYREKNLTCEIYAFSDIPKELIDVSGMKFQIELANQFKELVFGLHLMYRFLLSEKEDALVLERLEQWREDFNPQDVQLTEIFKLASRASKQTQIFLSRSLEYIPSKNWLKQLEENITKRELTLKGNRAKIGKKEYKPSQIKKINELDSIKLDFRSWRVGVIFRDILKGLGIAQPDSVTDEE